MRVSALFVAAFVGLAAAQSTTTSSAAAVQTTVAADDVDTATKNTWCRAQLQSCPTLCGGDTANNTCIASTLTYNCTCTADIALNVSDFTQTLPSLECEYAVAECVADHPDDASGQATCQSVTCGSKNVTSQVTSTSSAAASSTATSTSNGSAAASTAAASATATGGAAALNFAKNYGSGALVAGGLALFGLAL